MQVNHNRSYDLGMIELLSNEGQATGMSSGRYIRTGTFGTGTFGVWVSAGYYVIQITSTFADHDHLNDLNFLCRKAH
jgi:hypothetical protein